MNETSPELEKILSEVKRRVVVEVLRKRGIVLRAGATERVDMSTPLADWCCETVEGELVASISWRARLVRARHGLGVLTKLGLRRLAGLGRREPR